MIEAVSATFVRALLACVASTAAPEAEAAAMLAVPTDEATDSVPSGAAARDQEDADDEPTEAETIDRHIRFARTGSARIRPQAAMRLVRSHKDAAADRLTEVAGDTPDELALLGTALIEVLGMFENEGLRSKLWPALEDPDFPWRPAAARSLAFDPEDSEWDRLKLYVDDPIAPVRVAALDGLFRLTVDGDPTAKRTEEELAEHEERAFEFLNIAADRLDDPNDNVRRRAAILLDARGHGRALLWLVEDLARVDTFFERPSGMMARSNAARDLADRGIELGGYVPMFPPSGGEQNNSEALAAIESAVRERARAMTKKLPEDERDLVPSELPEVARAVPPVEGAVIGLELKSCRRGEFFLRWTEGDELIVGDGNPARIELPEGTTRRLLEAARTARLETEGVMFGQPGCDMETYRMPRSAGDEGRGAQQFIISKGAERVEDLRPGSLTRFARALVESIPSSDGMRSSDPRTAMLEKRVRSAFASIGGPVTGSGAVENGNEASEQPESSAGDGTRAGR